MKRNVFITVFAAAFLVFLACVLLSPPRTDSLQVSMVSHSTDATNLEVKVTNTSRRIVNFAFWVEVLKDGKWVQDDVWDPKMKGQLHWIAGHTSNNIRLDAPEDSATWRLKVMGEEQPTTLKWKWLSLWKKVGLKGEPRQWYLYLDADK